MRKILKTTSFMAAPILFASMLAGCPFSGDSALDAPATVNQMGSAANVLIKNNVSNFGADVGGSAAPNQRGVAMPGDLDGDGYADLIVTNVLCVHILYGSPTWPRTIEVEKLPTLIPTDPALGDGCGRGTGTDMLGHGIPKFFQTSVAAAGDVDHDGYADFLVGYTVMADTTEISYLVYGGPTRISGRQQVADFAPVFTAVGGRVTGIGDSNGDGYADLAATNAHRVDFPAQSNTPSALVFFGSAKRFVGQVSADQAGASVSIPDTANYVTPVLRGVGDLNGDGYADFLIGAVAKEPSDLGPALLACDAKAWVVAGRSPLTGNLRLSGAPLIEGIAVGGCREGMGTGVDSFDTTPGLGDLDGDGFGDLAFKTVATDQTSITTSTNILYGRADMFARTNPADASFPSTNALVSADVDGDGILDLVAGDLLAENGDGAVYVRLGTRARLTGSMDFSQGAFRIASSRTAGIAGENVGRWLAAGADVDGDGKGDLLVGATLTMNSGSPFGFSNDPTTNTGHAYLVRGAALSRALGR